MYVSPSGDDAILGSSIVKRFAHQGQTVYRTQTIAETKLFCSHWGVVISRTALIDGVWGGDQRDAENNLDVLIAGLRKKLEKKILGR